KCFCFGCEFIPHRLISFRVSVFFLKKLSEPLGDFMKLLWNRVRSMGGGLLEFENSAFPNLWQGSRTQRSQMLAQTLRVSESVRYRWVKGENRPRDVNRV